MSHAAAAPLALPDAARRAEAGNIARLAIGQALAGANSNVVYGTGAIVGDEAGHGPGKIGFRGIRGAFAGAGDWFRKFTTGTPF